MHSMTGYGRARVEEDGREMTVELKTVNHRFLDVNLRMPRGLVFLEEALRGALSARLNRGHADVFLTYRNARADARALVVDTALLGAYSAAYDQIIAQIHCPDDRTVSSLAALPDVLSLSEKEEDQQAVTDLCKMAMEQALDALVLMRQKEGDALAADLRARMDRLLSIAGEIAARAPHVAVDAKTRLEARLAELLNAPVDPQRLAQEVALLADRAAIDEELVRLSSHLAQMEKALQSDEPIGRKLDFLVQELNREVNTIGAKASDLQIGALVVEAKAEIEKIREQVQNIE